MVEDSKDHAGFMQCAFKSHEGHINLTIVHSLRDARKVLKGATPDLVIAGFILPDGNGIDFLPANKEDMSFPVVIMANHADEQLAVEVMKAGASDYIVKSTSTFAAMPRICERALREWRCAVDRKRMEERLLQSEKLRAIGIMSAGIAHDFNNILAIIDGNIQLSLQNYDRREKLMEQLKVVRKVAKDGAEIVRRMAEFTREKDGHARLETVNIINLIKQAIKFTTPRWKDMAQSNGITYNFNTDCLKSVSIIQGNPSGLREIFVNLINNSLDAMYDGGTLSFKSWEGDETIFVRISDTGTGISDDVKARIYDPFFTTKGTKGSGLGMSVVNSIVKRHNGKIEVQNNVGKGCTFILSFPASQQAMSPVTVLKPVQHKKGMGRRVLVVDDQVEICRFMENMLTKNGYSVKTVDSGAGAIELLKSTSFDLVLSDLCMPEVSGIEVLDYIEKHGNGTKTGLITGWSEQHKTITNKEIKADFIINKPIDFSLLSGQIQKVLGL